MATRSPVKPKLISIGDAVNQLEDMGTADESAILTTRRIELASNGWLYHSVSEYGYVNDVVKSLIKEGKEVRVEPTSLPGLEKQRLLDVYVKLDGELPDYLKAVAKVAREFTAKDWASKVAFLFGPYAKNFREDSDGNPIVATYIAHKMREMGFGNDAKILEARMQSK